MSNLKCNDNIFICSDFDETISHNNNVSKKTIREIQSFIDAGGLFTLATGRMYRGIDNQEILHLCNLPLICANGAIICNPTDGTVLHEKYIAGCEFYNMLEGCTCCFLNIHIVCPNGSINLSYDKFAETNCINKIYRVEWECKNRADAKKLFAFLKPKISSEAFLNCELGRVVFSVATKGFALQYLCETFNIQREVVCIGDDYTDLSFLDAAFDLYVPKNAKTIIRKKATQRLDCTAWDNPIAEVRLRKSGIYGKRHILLYLKSVHAHRREVYTLCNKLGLRMHGFFHDLSKYTLTEINAGSKYYVGNISPISIETRLRGYSKAWTHHVRYNKHHNEHWIIYENDKKIHIEMPTVYWIEQVCDRIAACKIYLGDAYTNFSPYERFEHEFANRPMNKQTAENVRQALQVLAKNGEDGLLKYLRKILDEERK